MSPAGAHGRAGPGDLGAQVMRWADELARSSETEDALTVTFCSDAHVAVARALLQLMRENGFDDARVDAVGNVVGRYRAQRPAARQLLTGSHYDTVRDGGRYDGRLGILAPIAAVGELARRGERLAHDVVVIGFSDEEGVRFGSTFLGSSAVVGRFDHALLDRRDASGVSMRDAMLGAGLAPDRIGEAALSGDDTIGYVEIHIEQGPVLLERRLALGAVTAINGAVRLMIELHGESGHAGTTPMPARHDAACAAAELVLQVEARCAGVPGLVGTCGILETPGGSVNVIPGRCRVSVDVRAPDDAVRDAALADIRAGLEAIAARRGVRFDVERILEAGATAVDPALKALWLDVIRELGQPPFELASGAGHDAICLAGFCPMAMLFVRCGNGGVSHSPDETMAAEDADLAARAFLAYVRHTSRREEGR